eukprot:tig00020538_g10378.t1
MNFDEKAGLVWAPCGAGKWSQTRNEVHIMLPAPPGTRGKDVLVEFKPSSLKAGLKGQPLMIEGQLGGLTKPEDSIWTLEDVTQRPEDGKEIRIVLQKGKEHDVWNFLVPAHGLDPFKAEEMQKKMMLEKFQAESPGFDFSGAEFTGQVPSNPYFMDRNS